MQGLIIGRMAVGFLAGLFCLVSAAGQVAALDLKSSSFTYAVDMQTKYPVTDNVKVDVDIREWLEGHLEKIMQDWNGMAVSPELPDGGINVGVTFGTETVSPKILSVIFETYVYPLRAAHPSSRMDVLNYDLSSGERLGLSDVFDRPDVALRIMSEGGRAILAEALSKSSPGDLGGGVPEGNWFMEGLLPEEKNFAAMVLEPGGVRVIFQQYQVLPYSFGMPSAFYSLEMLKEAGPRAAIWGEEAVK